MTILATSAIRIAINDGKIVCTPRPPRIEGAHIDITLGRWYWMRTRAPSGLGTSRCFALADADPLAWYTLREAQEAVWLPAQSFALCHTEEFIGTTADSDLVPMLHTRSTLARWGLSIHASAGQGDSGFVGRWTLEIWNHHHEPVAIPVGARVGGVAFHHADGLAMPYEARYNIGPEDWTPQAMLPRIANW